MEPTTYAMVVAARDAYDVAAADTAVARAALCQTRSQETIAKYVVAAGGREYAAAVLASVLIDYERSVA